MGLIAETRQGAVLIAMTGNAASSLALQADGVAFDLASVNGAAIRKEAGYGGVRVDLLATLDGARIALQVDIGFGDAVTPAPESVNYPVLLHDLPARAAACWPDAVAVPCPPDST